MSSLENKKIKDSYKDLLQISNNNTGIDNTLRSISDGEGTISALKISSSEVSVDGKLEANNITINNKSVATQEWVTSNTSTSSLINWTETNGHIIPNSNASFDLGNAEYKVRHLFLSDNSLWFGDEIKLESYAKKKRNRSKLPKWFEINTPGVTTEEIFNWHNTEFDVENKISSFEEISLFALTEFAKIKIGNTELTSSDIYPSQYKEDGSINETYDPLDYEYIIDDNQSFKVNSFLSNLNSSDIEERKQKILQIDETGDGIQFVDQELLKGEQGIPGIQGQVGPEGQKGESGIQGVAGPQGDIGPGGLKGEKGNIGNQGVPGPQGDIGLKGDQGNQGDAFTFSDFTTSQLETLVGEKGDKGETAPRGIDGTDGEKGEPGEQGVPGPQGDIGLKGEQGNQGDKGDAGEKGEQGIGEKGDKGTDGQDGVGFLSGASLGQIHYSGGNVGIGTNNPSAPLAINASPYPYMSFDNFQTNSVEGVNLGAIFFKGKQPDGSVETGAGIRAVAMGTATDSNNDMPSELRFSTNPGGTGGLVNRVAISKTGNVGIGTTAQTNNLVIVANSNTNSTLSNDPPYIVIENTKSPYSNNNVFGGYVFSKTGSSNVHGSLSSGIRAGMYAVYNGATENQVSSNVGLSLRFQTSAQDAGNGNVRMVINGDGRIGMGILSPTQGLHIANGNLQCQSQIRATGWFSGSPADVEPACEIGMSGGKGYVMAYDRGNGSYKEIVLQSHYAYFNLKQDGKIGLNTTDPDTELHIMSSGHADASGQATIKLQSRKADGFSTGILFSNSSETSNGAIFYHADNYMRFNVGGTGVSTERMRIDSTGAVIINSGVISSGAFGTISSGGTLVTVVPAVDNTRVFSLIGASNRTRGGAIGTIDIRTPQASDFPKGAISTGFTSWNLNNTNPYADFINFNTYTDSSGGNSTMMLVSKTSNGIKFSRLGFSVDTNYSSGSIYTVNVTSGSDASVKENVNEITNGLQKISALRPVTFHWTNEYIENGFSKNESENVYDENGERILPNQKITNVGLIAQEVEKVIPTVVHNDRISLSGTEDTIKNIDYDKIVPYLIASIKELKSQNDDLLNRIKSLEET